jgi:hypothetical protein
VTGRGEQLAPVRKYQVDHLVAGGHGQAANFEHGRGDSEAVDTSMPGRMAVTRTSPCGVAMSVPAARQIGQFGAPAGVRELTVPTPSPRTVPLISR